MGQTTNPAPDIERERMIQATAWFSILVHARHTNNFGEAAEAQREPERLGVVVKFRRMQHRETAAC